MNEKTQEALKKAIRAWEHRAETLMSGCSAEACPLCALFANGVDARNLCTGCPVSGFTGQVSCEGSPWPDYVRARIDFRQAADKLLHGVLALCTPQEQAMLRLEVERAQSALRAACEAEVRFLKYLLPEP